MHKTPNKTKRKKSTHINTRKKIYPTSKKVLAIIFKVCPYVFEDNENRGKQKMIYGMIELHYKTSDGCNWRETFITLEEAAKAAIQQLGHWESSYHFGYLINEYGDCKLCDVVGTTMEKLENEMMKIEIPR